MTTIQQTSAEEVISYLTAEDTPESQREELFADLISRPLSSELLVEGVHALRKKMIPVELSANALDTCGTGGSGLKTINTSTLTALIVAACGGKVAKHGNRSASGNCGCFDLLVHLGIRINLTPDQEQKVFNELGIVFLFAPSHHPSLRFVAPLRKKHGKKTLFNLIGPLCNPAGAKRQVLGTGNAEHAPMIADTLKKLGSGRAMVVRGDDGLDEVTITGPSTIYSVNSTHVARSTFSPTELGIPLAHSSEIEGDSVERNAEVFLELLEGKGEIPKRNLVLVNAAHALIVAGLSTSIKEAFGTAEESLMSGKAASLFERYKEFNSQL